jgi:hypothetical protein
MPIKPFYLLLRSHTINKNNKSGTIYHLPNNGLPQTIKTYSFLVWVGKNKTLWLKFVFFRLHQDSPASAMVLIKNVQHSSNLYNKYIDRFKKINYICNMMLWVVLFILLMVLIGRMKRK